MSTRELPRFVALAVILFASACNITVPNMTPTPESLLTETPSPTASLTPEAEVNATPTLPITRTSQPSVPIVVTAQPVVEQVVPTSEITPTETPGPYEYVIQANDTLGSIIQRQPWSYPYDTAVIQAVVALNPNIINADILPPVGSTILIPQRTPTPVPDGLELTLTSDASIGFGSRVGGVVLPAGSVPGCHVVESGDTLVGIADIYSTTLEVLSQLNQNLNWFGCNFTQYSGGPSCNPIIREDQCITVPLPTTIPSATPTPSGNETATPTPTYAPARLVFPPDGAIAPAGVFTLQWTSVGILPAGYAYLVEVQDLSNGEAWSQITRGNGMLLPDTLIPSDGTVHSFQWRVVIVRDMGNATYEYAGGTGDWRRFQWQSR